MHVLKIPLILTATKICILFVTFNVVHFAVGQSVGLKMATNLAVRVPRCLLYKGSAYHQYENIGNICYVCMSSLMHAFTISDLI